MVIAAILASVNHNRDDEDTVNHVNDLVEPMPPEDEVVFSGIVQKREYLSNPRGGAPSALSTLRA